MIEVLSWITDFVCLAAQWKTGNKPFSDWCLCLLQPALFCWVCIWLEL